VANTEHIPAPATPEAAFGLNVLTELSVLHSEELISTFYPPSGSPAEATGTRSRAGSRATAPGSVGAAAQTPGEAIAAAAAAGSAGGLSGALTTISSKIKNVLRSDPIPLTGSTAL